MSDGKLIRDRSTEENRAFWEGCRAVADLMPSSELIAEIARLRALVAKRERQIVWALGYSCAQNAGNRLTYYVADRRPMEHVVHDGTDAGLLAAVDEAMGE